MSLHSSSGVTRKEVGVRMGSLNLPHATQHLVIVVRSRPPAEVEVPRCSKKMTPPQAFLCQLWILPLVRYLLAWLVQVYHLHLTADPGLGSQRDHYISGEPILGNRTLIIDFLDPCALLTGLNGPFTEIRRIVREWRFRLCVYIDRIWRTAAMQSIVSVGR